MPDDLLTPETLAALFPSITPALLRYLRRRGCAGADAEDLVQDVLVRALETLAAGVPIPHGRRWLYRVALHLLIDAWRKRAERPHQPLTEATPEPACMEAQAEHRERLAEILTLLGPDKMRLLMAHYAHGYTYAELARVLGTTDGALRTKTNRAKWLVQARLVS